MPPVAAVALSAVLVLSLIAVPAGLVAGTSGQSVSDGAALSPTGTAQVDVPEENNTSIQHRNPEDVDASGDLGMVQAWLEGRMGTVLVDCTEGLAVGSYDVCDRLDGEYPEWAGKYVDLAEETDETEDDDTGPAFQDSRDRLDSLSEDVREFRTTYRDYREARRQGNQTRTRQLARELVEIAEEIDETTTPLVEDYRRISNTTTVDLQPQVEQLGAVNENVSTVAEQVESREFAPTTLIVSLQSATFSYRQPLQVSGQLRADGESLAGGQIVLEAGEDQVRTTTDESGTFTLSYRPTDLPLSVDSVTVRYVPDPESAYRSSTASRDVEVRQVTPSITVGTELAEARFDEQVTADGRLTVDGEPVDGVPIVIVADGHRVGRQQSDSTGRYTVPFRVPATIPAGTRTVVAPVPFEDRALAGVNATADLVIEPTPTSLSVVASESEPGRLSVQGELATADGTPVDGQPIQLQIDGSEAKTVQTTDGEFGTTTALSGESGDDDGNVTVVVTAIFTGEGTNLEASRASTEITVSPPPDGTQGSIGGAVGTIRDRGRELVQSLDGTGLGAILAALTWWQWLLVGMVVLAVIAGTYVFRERLANAIGGSAGGRQPTDDSGDTDAKTAFTSPDGSEGEGAAQPADIRPLDASRRQLDAGEGDAAVVSAYASVRSGLQDTTGDGRALTHWEFLEICRENGLTDEDVLALEQVTEAYEEAAFAPDPIESERAAGALDAAERLM